MKAMNFSRRNFLKMKAVDPHTPLRPPWSIQENAFQQACTRCAACIQSCPENILIREGHDGYPYVDFSLGECTFCGLCVAQCPTDALDHNQARTWSAKASITAQCLTSQQVVCTSCAEVCETSAIQFSHVWGHVAKPRIQADTCTGCGACVALCPTQAIEVNE